MGRCDPGLRKIRSLVVQEQHTDRAHGSGDVPVLGAPALLALAEGACVDAIAGDVPSDQTSLGVWAEVEQDRQATVGETLEAEATLTGHHGRRLEFKVIVRHDDEIVARVRHRRMLVDRERVDGMVAEPQESV